MWVGTIYTNGLDDDQWPTIIRDDDMHDYAAYPLEVAPQLPHLPNEEQGSPPSLPDYPNLEDFQVGPNSYLPQPLTIVIFTFITIIYQQHHL